MRGGTGRQRDGGDAECARRGCGSMSVFGAFMMEAVAGWADAAWWDVYR